MDFAIQPGRGIGSVSFGFKRDEVAEELGQPDRVDESDVDVGERCIEWHYDALNVSFYFDEDADFRLGLVDAGSLDVSVLGVRPIGLELDEAMVAFEKLGGLSLDEEFVDLRRSAYDLQSEFVTIWFQDGVCDSIQAFVPIDSNDEYVWPSGPAA